MKTKDYLIGSLIFAEYNPRQLTKEQYRNLRDSIERFGFVDPVIINKHPERENIVIGGHQRIRIAEDMGMEKVPCVELNLSLDKERELNVRLNRNVGEWDWDALANYFDVGELAEWGFKEEELGWDSLSTDDDFYTKEITSVAYEPNGEKPEIDELCDLSKVKKLIGEIENSKELSDEEKEFLTYAAYRHTVFNYSKIADFYAHSGEEVKKLMEDSALVIIDHNRAIELGYVVLSKDLLSIMDKDYAE